MYELVIGKLRGTVTIQLGCASRCNSQITHSHYRSSHFTNGPGLYLKVGALCFESFNDARCYLPLQFMEDMWPVKNSLNPKPNLNHKLNPKNILTENSELEAISFCEGR